MRARWVLATVAALHTAHAARMLTGSEPDAFVVLEETTKPCKLLGGVLQYALQGVLGLTAMFSLLYKRHYEVPQRPLLIWFLGACPIRPQLQRWGAGVACRVFWAAADRALHHRIVPGRRTCPCHCSPSLTDVFKQGSGFLMVSCKRGTRPFTSTSADRACACRVASVPQGHFLNIGLSSIMNSYGKFSARV